MRLAYVIHYVADVSQSVAFYEQAFGLKARFVHESGGYAELDTGATALAFASEEIARGSAPEFASVRRDRPAPGTEVGFVVEDVGAAYEKALKAGAIAVSLPTSKPWGQIVSYVRDGDGFLVELCTAVG